MVEKQLESLCSVAAHASDLRLAILAGLSKSELARVATHIVNDRKDKW